MKNVVVEMYNIVFVVQLIPDILCNHGKLYSLLYLMGILLIAAAKSLNCGSQITKNYHHLVTICEAEAK